MNDPVHGAEIGSLPPGPLADAVGGGWSWREPHHGEHFRTCSYCGCINPEDLTAEPVWRASWADRKYGWPHKFYVDVPNRQPDALFAIATSSGQEPPAWDLAWVRWADLSPEQLALVERDRMVDVQRPPAWIGFGTRPVHHAKFYSVHLADPALLAEVKDAIERRCGLRFTWLPDGRVSWQPYPYGTEPSRT